MCVWFAFLGGVFMCFWVSGGLLGCVLPIRSK